MLRECNYHGGQYCRHYVPMVVMCTKGYVRSVNRAPDPFTSAVAVGLSPARGGFLSVYRNVWKNEVFPLVLPGFLPP